MGDDTPRTLPLGPGEGDSRAGRGEGTPKRRTAPHRRSTRVGVLADTHGLLRPEALAALEGSELIVHAGDVGDRGILTALRGIAPVTVVRGNVDSQRWAAVLPETEIVEVAGARLYVLHDVHTLDLDPAAAGLAAVVFGHSHRPLVERRDGVLYLNPGSCGPRRFDLPVTLARLTVAGGEADATIVELDIS
jgi:putative phosphoesterase